MRIIGIVSEYNPFHNGHLYHVDKSREIVGPDAAVVCAMSGNFVQRGEAAVFEKYARAEAACASGCDIVFELPVPWSVSSAEGFARGAVSLLASLGVVTHLSFGSECGDIQQLSAVAEALLNPGINELIVEELKSGISYAGARQVVLEREIGSLGKIIGTPNNILAVEYLKELSLRRSNITPVTVMREGARHDRHEEGEFRSASELRHMLSTDKSIVGHIPPQAEEVYQRETNAGRGPVLMGSLETAVISRLRMLPAERFNEIPDSGEGLGNRLERAAKTEPTLDGIISAAKTKRYALSRIRRMCISAALGIEAELHREGVPYAKILAASSRGREILKTISEKSDIPVITKPAAVNALDSFARKIFNLESAAADLYSLGFSAVEERRGGRDFRSAPAML